MSALDRVRLLHARPIRSGWTTASLLVLSLATATAVVVGVLSVPASVEAAAGRADELLPSHGFVVVAPTSHGLDASLASEITAVPGVAVGSAGIRRKLLVDGAEALLLAFDAQVLRLDGPASPARCGIDPVELLRGGAAGRALPVGPGGAVTVRTTNGTRERVEVVGRTTCEALGELNGGRVLVTDLARGQRLTARPGRADLVAVQVADGRDVAAVSRAVRRVVGSRASVQAPEVARDQASLTVAPLTSGVSVVAGITAVVAAFVVYSAVAGATARRRPQFAFLRAVGLRRRSVRRGLLLETGAIAMAGTALGVAAGVPLAGALVGRTPRIVVDAVGYEPTTVVPIGLAAAVAAAVAAVTMLAARGPVTRVVGVEPLEAMRSSRGGRDATEDARGGGARRLALLALGATVASLGVLRWIDGPASYLSIVTAAAAAIVGLLAASGPLLRAGSRVLERCGPAGRLAAIELGSRQRRTVTLLVAMFVAASTLVGFRGLIDDVRATYAQDMAALGEPDLVLQAGRQDQIAFDHRITPAVLRAVQDVDGVAEVASNSQTLVWFGAELVQVNSVGDWDRDPGARGASSRALAEVRAGRAVVANRTFLAVRGLRVGDRIDLPTAEGPKSLPIADVGGYFSLTPGGVVAVGERPAARWFPSEGVGDAYLWFEPGLDDAGRARTRAAVRTVIERLDPGGVSIGSGTSFVAGLVERVGAIPGMLNSILVATLLAALLATAHTVSEGLQERERELAVLAAVGASTATLRRSVRLVVAATAVIGGGAGLLAGIVLHPILLHALAEATVGSRFDHRFDPTALGLGVVGMTGTALAGSLLATARSIRRAPLEALHHVD